MTTDRDPATRIVLSWLREDQHENPERMLLRALDEVDTTPQRRSWWPARRTFRLNKLAIAAATAAVLVVAFVGYNLLPRLGMLGPGAAPSPSPTLLARGTFIDCCGYTVEIAAFTEGSSVTGRMIVSLPAPSIVSLPPSSITVDLQCVRKTEDGFLEIGGLTTAVTNDGAGIGDLHFWAGIRFKPGSPVQGEVWSIRGGGSDANSCLEYLDERERLGFGRLGPIVGTVELGPAR